MRIKLFCEAQDREETQNRHSVAPWVINKLGVSELAAGRSMVYCGSSAPCLLFESMVYCGSSAPCLLFLRYSQFIATVPDVVLGVLSPRRHLSTSTPFVSGPSIARDATQGEDDRVPKDTGQRGIANQVTNRSSIIREKTSG
jgi:hypothetical protein